MNTLAHTDTVNAETPDASSGDLANDGADPARWPTLPEVAPDAHLEEAYEAHTELDEAI